MNRVDQSQGSKLSVTDSHTHRPNVDVPQPVRLWDIKISFTMSIIHENFIIRDSTKVEELLTVRPYIGEPNGYYLSSKGRRRMKI